MNRVLCRLLAVSLLLQPSFIRSQTQEESLPSFTSRAELVLVTAVVTSHGEAVRGLTKSDFELLNDGASEKVAFVEEVEASASRVEAAQLPQRTVQNYATGDSHQDVVLLLLDYLNGSWFTTANINSYLEDLSRKLTETHTPASVLLLSTKGLVEAHSFTTDMQSFNRAIQQIGSKNSKGNTITAARGVGWTNALAATTDVEATTIFREYALPTRLIEQIKLDRAAMTQQALEQLAESYRGIPGRKKLIWISTGFPLGLTPTQLSSRPANPLLDANPLTEFQIQEKASRAWRALSDANISVYPIDSNGAAITNSPSADFSKGPFGAPTAISIGTNTMSLMEVAKRTGGRFCTDEPDTCLKKALVDGPHYYVLGFYLSKEPKPGWHKLKVKVRRPETSVRARDGFFAGDRPQEQESKDRVLTALASPLDYTSVPLRLRWNTGTLDGKRAVQLVLNSPPGGVELNPEDSSLNLDILAYVRQLGAAEGKSFPATVSSKVTPTLQASLATSGFQFRKQITLDPGRYEVRMFLRDNVSNKIGTVSTIVDLGK